MGRQLQADQAELYRRCDEVLHYIWDPIGVSGAPGARDEYFSYLPHVFQLVCDGSGSDQIVEYLIHVQISRMGMAPNQPRAEAAAAALLEWREWIASRAS